jgi:hypothetical protein
MGLDDLVGEDGEQDYEIWSVTVPYLSAGDLMNIYFDSANIPTPNRMNWKGRRNRCVAETGPLGADRSRSSQSITRWCSRR